MNARPCPLLGTALLALSLLASCGLPEEKTDDTSGTVIADRDADGYDAEVDCDDNEATVHPEAIEICNGIDDDCDDLIDNADSSLSGGDSWWPDLDEDGFGANSGEVAACSNPSGYIARSGDCDDNDPLVHPEATEICNEIDDDCDALVDDADDTVEGGTTWYLDSDADGFGATKDTVLSCDPQKGTSSLSGDCDDENPEVFPEAPELCNEIDDDCDSRVDDADDDVEDALAWYPDNDRDGWGYEWGSALSCEPPAGWLDSGGDCDDSNASVHPGATERCNGYDDNCDDIVDDEDPEVTDTRTWYADRDADGYGDERFSSESCEAPDDTVADATDCNDSSAEVHPGATELCNGLDDDCNDLVPDNEIDHDGDGLLPCEGDDEGGAEGIYEVGGTTSSWLATSYYRGNVFRPSSSGTLDSFDAWLGLTSSCTVDFYVHRGSTSAGPWTVVWSGRTSASSGTGYISSGDISYDYSSGFYYALGVGWSCSATYYAATDTGVDGGIGTFANNVYNNSYGGYSTSFTPAGAGTSSTCYAQTIYVFE